MTSKLALYVSQGPDLVHYSLNPDDATITRHGSVTVPQEVQYAWVHPTNRYIYVTSSTGTGTTDHHLDVFAIGPDGALNQIGGTQKLVHRAIHLSVDAEGKYLMIAYNSPSLVTIHLINPDGSVGEQVAQPEGLDTGNYPHQIRVTPSNKSAVLAGRGTHKPGVKVTAGSLEVYDFKDGVLTHAQKVSPNLEFGPRHLDFHPTKPWVYASFEHSNEIKMYELKDDRLSQDALFSASILAEPDNERPRQMGGTIHVHPSGRYVYVANRGDYTVKQEGQKVFGGGENHLAVFEIDQTTGEPRHIQFADPLGFYIRCFDIDPEGRLLVTASLNDMNVPDGSSTNYVPRRITLFRVGGDGKLTIANKVDVHTGEKRQWWMKIVTLPAAN